MLALAAVGRNVGALQAFSCLCIQTLPNSARSPSLSPLGLFGWFTQGIALRLYLVG